MFSKQLRMLRFWEPQRPWKDQSLRKEILEHFNGISVKNYSLKRDEKEFLTFLIILGCPPSSTILTSILTREQKVQVSWCTIILQGCPKYKPRETFSSVPMKTMMIQKVMILVMHLKTQMKLSTILTMKISPTPSNPKSKFTKNLLATSATKPRASTKRLAGSSLDKKSKNVWLKSKNVWLKLKVDI